MKHKCTIITMLVVLTDCLYIWLKAYTRDNDN